MITRITPLFAYTGGKTRLASWILEHMPPHIVYVEVFGGMASVLLAKQPSKIEVYNDLYSDLAHFMRCLRHPKAYKRLIEKLEHTEYGTGVFNYCRMGLVNKQFRGIKRAWAFAVQGLMCYGGNVAQQLPSFGRRKGADNVSSPLKMQRKIDQIELISQRLRMVVIENSHALDVIQRYDSKDTLFYCDPPYENAIQYNESIDFDALFSALNKATGMVLLSGYMTERHKLHFDGWECSSTTANVTISTNNHHEIECLWMNQAAKRALNAQLF